MRRDAPIMRNAAAAAGSAVFFALAPGVVAGVIPWWITRWHIGQAACWLPLRLAGLLLIAVGLPVLVSAFVRFVSEGRGTPAPVAPTERLVIGGLYRHVRNPMYLAVLALIAGQALALCQLSLLWYAAATSIAFAAFVCLYEDPALARRFGAQYDAYCQAVPAWVPRLRRWRPGGMTE